MIGKLLKTRIKALVLTLVIGLSFVACGSPKPVEVPKDPNKKVEDKAMTKKIESESIVSGSKVYLEDKIIFAALIIKKDAKQEQIDKVVDKYAKKLKKEYKNLQEEYKGMKINIQAVQSGKNVANILIEK